MNCPLAVFTAVVSCTIQPFATLAAGLEVEPPLPALDQRISLELREAAVEDVFRSLERLLSGAAPESAAATPVRIELEPGIDRTLTICVRDVTVRTMMMAACESLGCRLSWHSEGAGYVLLVQPDETRTAEDEAESPELAALDAPVDLDLAEARLGAVIQTVGTITNRKVLIDDRLKDRTVSLSVKATPLFEVLDLLCKQAGCRWRETTLGMLEFTVL